MKHHLASRSELSQVLQTFKQTFYQLGAFSAVINLLMLLPSIYMLQIYDRVLHSRNETTLLMLTLLMLGLYGLMSVLELVRSSVLIRVGNRLDMQLNFRVFTAAFERNLRKNNGNASQALHDLTSVRQFLTGNGLFAFFDAPWAPIYLAVTFMFHWILGLFVLGGMIILCLLAWLTERSTRKPLAEANQASIAAGNYANNNLRNAEVIEAMGMLPALRERWFLFQSRVLEKQTEASDKAARIGALSKLVRLSLQSLVLAVGALLAIQNEISPGMMIAGSILMGRALQPVEMAIGTWKQLNSARAAYQRLEELLAEFPARISGMSLPRPQGRVQVENVVAAAPGSGVPILKGINFAIEHGDIVGVVGPSAAGKSTLARLLVGIWPAHSGKVRLDGADIFQWNKDELGPHIGYLPQDVELFDGSIAENIARFGDIDSERVIEAASRAGVHEMILHFAQGYDTRLGDGGHRLSGGQKQRIGLARAIYASPAFVVLDEPNSNLDDVGEQALIHTVMDLKAHGTTVVLITHRTSILNAVDKLLVMREGQLHLFGPRDQVLYALSQAAQQVLQQQQAAMQGQADQTSDENHA
ncbi:type I secretion system permease/ATPase [Aquitalea aquatica]|uniref:Type I secretion system permease/ATPase n=1 Tax=Aquitalea aquatica TaxID=3044273 RepID=A0A838Y7Q5_9NEIS|nr:type I secretion system permease/ATPase [Aquitalea magnusonii]MBA4710716.1 type I secretion system permease/ATPase [Aquitalea magnusonii]